jgi:hypothetical protein
VDTQVVAFTNPGGEVAAAGDGASVVVGGSGDSNEESGTSTEDWIARTPWVAPPDEACPLEVRWWVGSLETAE